MYRILSRKELNPTVTQMEIEAPLVANKAKAGQFIILRVDEDGERIPLTIAGADRKTGAVKIIFQIVGATTEKLNHKKEGQSIQDFVGPLGKPTDIEGKKNVCIVGGGVGCAIALPVAQALKAQGSNVTSIIGFRNKDLLILEDEFKEASNELIVMTDDGSYARHGNDAFLVFVLDSQLIAVGLALPMVPFSSAQLSHTWLFRRCTSLLFFCHIHRSSSMALFTYVRLMVRMGNSSWRL